MQPQASRPLSPGGWQHRGPGWWPAGRHSTERTVHCREPTAGLVPLTEMVVPGTRDPLGEPKGQRSLIRPHARR